VQWTGEDWRGLERTGEDWIVEIKYEEGEVSNIYMPMSIIISLRL